MNRPKRTPFTELTKAKLDFRFWCEQVTAEGEEIVCQKQQARSLCRKPPLAPPSALHSALAIRMAQWPLPAQSLILGLVALTRTATHSGAPPHCLPQSLSCPTGDTPPHCPPQPLSSLSLSAFLCPAPILFGCVSWSLTFSIRFLGVLPHFMFILGTALADGESFFCVIRRWW